ncbi:MAG: tyrosine--tRNA ligase [Halobacteriaceae archaeon]
MKEYDLISRNVVEVITEEEVRELAANPEGKRVYVGYEPSGVLHVGHTLAANKLIDLQECGFEVVILLADVHAYLNEKGTFEEIRETARQMKSQFLAYGLDEASTEFVFGTDFQLEEEYVLDLHSLGQEVTLKRAQRAMAELQGGETAKVSHVIYPLMQALDIEYLDLDLAVGGMDQRKVHMLHREEIPSLGYEARPCIHTPIIADLTSGEGKMSSSTGITISMEDSKAELQEKINAAFCPPTRDPEGDLENPVLQLFQYHVFPRFEAVEVDRPEKYGGSVVYESYEELADAIEEGELHPADAKDTLARYLDELIKPGRERLKEFQRD